MDKNIFQRTVSTVNAIREKRVRKPLLACLSAVLLASSQFLTSCELETSDNENLDGFWHMERVDTLQTGGVKDTSKDVIFWSFQFNLMQLSDRNSAKYMARFSHTDGELVLSNFCLYDRTDGDVFLAEKDIAKIAHFGVNALTETFHVEHLSSSSMTLSNGTLRLYFKKF